MTQHNTTQQAAKQGTNSALQQKANCRLHTYNMLSLEFKLAWGENCSKNRKIRALGGRSISLRGRSQQRHD